MRIGILSREPKSYSTQRLYDAAKRRGHRVRVLNTLDFGIYVEEQAPELSYQGRDVPPLDALVPRIGASSTFYGTAVVRQFEQMGVYCLNSSQSISVSRDKLRSLQILSRHDIGIPSSAFVRRKEDVLPAIARMGGAPVVIKLLEGTQGVGVILADTITVAEAIVQTLQVARQQILIQKFVAESKGKDIRAFVIGDRVIAAIRRRAEGQEFRSNVHRGGSAEPVILDDHYVRTAVKAAQILGLSVAGVDMLEANDGPSVMEVNSSPGLEGIETATGLDIASQVIEYMEEHARFDDVDLRYRLTLDKGYGVAEVPVGKGSEFAGNTIGASGLREMEILVLSINRQGLTLPAPRGPQKILEGDVLLCYGKKMVLRNLLPEKRVRRRKKPKAGEASEPVGEAFQHAKET